MKKIFSLTLSILVAITFVVSPSHKNNVFSVTGWLGAANSVYNFSAPTQPSDINVSGNSGNSGSPKMVLDSFGRPHIVWSDFTYVSTGSYEIFYVRWNGTLWVGAAGSVYNPSATTQPADINVSRSSNPSTNPILRLDSAGNPHIAWVERVASSPENRDIYYVRWNGSDWVGANGSAYNPVVLPQPSDINVTRRTGNQDYVHMVLDSGNRPNFFYTDIGAQDVMFLKWSGSNWVGANNSVYNPAGTPPSDINVSRNSGDSRSEGNDLIAINSSGNPLVCWWDNSFRQGSTYNYEILILQYLPGTGWVSLSNSTYSPTSTSQGQHVNISRTTSTSANPSMAYVVGQGPYVAWQEDPGSGYDLYYAHYMGSGTTADWYGANGLLYNISTGANANVTRSSSTVSFNPHLRLDQSGNPCITWNESFSGGSSGVTDIMFARWNLVEWYGQGGLPYVAGNFASINVSNSSGLSQFPFLCIDSSSAPHIVFGDGSFTGLTEILYLKWGMRFDGSAILTKGVDTNGDGVFDNDGDTVVPGATLSYRLGWHFNNPNNDPLEDAYIYDSVPLGTNYVSGTANPTTLLSYSTNGGATWTPGEPPNGSPAGTLLRWGPYTGSSWKGAGGSNYTSAAASPLPLDINVSRHQTASVSTYSYQSVKLDSRGNPHVAWTRRVSGTYTLRYLRWDPTIQNWVGANGSVYNPTAAQPYDIDFAQNPNIYTTSPSLELDSNDNPHIAYAMTTGLCYMRWNPAISNWVNANGATYTPGTPNTMIAPLSTSTASNFQLELDANDNPHIAYTSIQYGTTDVMYVRFNSSTGNWVCANGVNYVSGAGNERVARTTNLACYQVDLKLDSSNNPHIVYSRAQTTSGSPWDIDYVRWSTAQNNWVNASNAVYNPGTLNANVSRSTGNSSTPCLELDSSNIPYVVWADDTTYGSTEVFIVRLNGTTWAGMNGTVYVPNIAQPSDINVSRTPTATSVCYDFALDNNGLPCVAWRDGVYETGGYSEVHFVRWNSAKTDWVLQDGRTYVPLMQSENISKHRNWDDSIASVIIDWNNNPHITFSSEIFTASSYDLLYIHWQAGPTDLAFNFSVRVDVPFNYQYTPICNSGWFRHKYDQGPIYSNSVCVDVGEIYMRKKAVKADYQHDEMIEFVVEVENPTGMYASNAIINDTFPQELQFVEVVPSGSIAVSGNVITYNAGSIPPFTTLVLTFRFRMKEGYLFGLTPITVTNFSDATTTEFRPVFAQASTAIHKLDYYFEKTATKKEFVTKDKPVFNFRVENRGTDPINYVKIKDMVPDVLVLESCTSPTSPSPAGFMIDVGTLVPGQVFTASATFSINQSKITGEETFIRDNVSECTCMEMPSIRSSVRFSILRPRIEIRKTAESMNVQKNGIAKFVIVVENTGRDMAYNLKINDVFPRELEFVSAQPEGVAGLSNLAWQIAQLQPGEKARFVVAFRVKAGKLPDDGLYVENRATVSADGLPQKSDGASVHIVEKDKGKDLKLDIKWLGIDIKKGEVKSGEEIELQILPEGGTGPYEIRIEWGDGNVSKQYTDGEKTMFKHTYGQTGEMGITITLTDNLARSVRVTRKILVK
ncbi:MAG: DUF11 domain-containing protein [Caldisericales bacterium]|nr:DUF11 domain-containing protein [Caldisericales bacterium]